MSIKERLCSGLLKYESSSGFLGRGNVNVSSNLSDVRCLYDVSSLN